MKPAREDGRTLFWPATAALAALFAGSDADPSKARARLDTVRAELGELELAKRRGELIEVADVTAVNLAVATTISTAILALPTRLAPLIDGDMPIATREAVIRQHVHEVLAELSNLGAEIGAEASERAA